MTKTINQLDPVALPTVTATTMLEIEVGTDPAFFSRKMSVDQLFTNVTLFDGGTFNGTFTTTTQPPADNSANLATTAYVDAATGGGAGTLAQALTNGNVSGPNDLIMDVGQVLTTDTINETTVAAGVTIETILLSGGVITGATSITSTGFIGDLTGNADTVTVADAGGDATTFPLLGTEATGSLAPATDVGLTYNATTNELTTTTFVGALTGNANTATTAATVTDATQNSITSIPNLVTVGALGSGSITSGFGNIDNGASTLDTGALNATSGSFSLTLGVTGVTTLNGQLDINDNNVVATGTAPKYALLQSGASADEGRWDIIASGDSLSFRSVNDAVSVGNVWLFATRSGATVDSLTITPNTTFSGDITISAGGISVTDQIFITTADVTTISTNDNAQVGVALVDGLQLIGRGSTNDSVLLNNAGGKVLQNPTGTLDLNLGGDLIIGTSGKGIDFSATPDAPGMVSELLDDYEEGTWTPAISFSGGSGTITYTTQNGHYTKIGNAANIWADLNTLSLSSRTGNAQIEGLPFISSGAIFGSAVVSFAAGLSIVAGQDLGLLILTGSSSASPYMWSSTGGTLLVTDSEWTDDGRIIFGGSYRV